VRFERLEDEMSDGEGASEVVVSRLAGGIAVEKEDDFGRCGWISALKCKRLSA
jgi:hypothetical protein